MCDVIMTEQGDVSSLDEMNARGWIVTRQDIDPSYLDAWTFEELVEDSCLCPVDVPQVLGRHGVAWTDDAFGYCVAPLVGDQEDRS